MVQGGLKARVARWLVAAVLAVAAAARAQQGNEVVIAEADFKKLDAFEGVMLGKADKAFGAREYRRAAAEYDSFILQYGKSAATAYALMRKGRSLQLDDKRFDAIKVFNEVLDYFPDAIDYAGAALFYMGECHWQNGEPKEAIKAWAEMAQDTDYRKHRLAAGAIVGLADYLVKQDKWAEAAEYYKQVGIDFHDANREAAQNAIQKVIQYYMRISPDEPKLRDFYDKARGFDWDPNRAEDKRYWEFIMEGLERHGVFAEADKANRENYYRYWASALEPKNPTWDDFQALAARCRLLADGNTATWIARLDEQYAKYQKPEDVGRAVKWIGYYAGNKQKVAEYYAKLAFDKLKNEHIVQLIILLYEKVNDYPLARNTIPKLHHDIMTDDARQDLAGRLWHRDEEGVTLVCRSMKDPDRGKMMLLRYYRDFQHNDKGLKLVDDVTKVPAYAKEAFMIKGELLQRLRRWADAIAAYQLSDSPPTSIFRIAECLLNDGKRDPAIGQLREIENFFPNEAPEAGLRVAYAYRDTNDNKGYEAALRAVMKKYPKSGQSSTAHQELERMGVRIGGGEDAE